MELFISCFSRSAQAQTRAQLKEILPGTADAWREQDRGPLLLGAVPDTKSTLINLQVEYGPISFFESVADIHRHRLLAPRASRDRPLTA